MPIVGLCRPGSDEASGGNRYSHYTEGQTSLELFMQDAMVTYHLPGIAVAIVSGGELIWSHGYGLSDIETSIFATDTTPFYLASISKTVTATALLQLWENDHFELDEPIAGFLQFPVLNPHFSNDSITFEMLLNHTSSIRDNWGVMSPLIVQGDSPIELADYLEGYFDPEGEYYNPDFNFSSATAPGNAYSYSNIAFCLAGHLVESISGVPFERFCRDSIFDPLGMAEAGWYLADLDTTTIAMPYTWISGGYRNDGHYHLPWYPSTTFMTSSYHLGRFLAAYTNYGILDAVRILDSATVDMMTTVTAPNGLGLAWTQVTIQTEHHGNRTAWGHDGAFIGSRTKMYYAPADSTGVIVLANSNPDFTNMWFIVRKLFDLAYDRDNDGVVDLLDNCMNDPNSGQIDSDGDGYGDVCDNCDRAFNPDQLDSDWDGLGDACDLCGDVDQNGEWDIDDIMFLVNYVFGAGPPPQPLATGDVQCSGYLDIADIVYLIAYIFVGGPAPCDPDGTGESDCWKAG